MSALTASLCKYVNDKGIACRHTTTKPDGLCSKDVGKVPHQLCSCGKGWVGRRNWKGVCSGCATKMRRSGGGVSQAVPFEETKVTLTQQELTAFFIARLAVPARAASAMAVSAFVQMDLAKKPVRKPSPPQRLATVSADEELDAILTA